MLIICMLLTLVPAVSAEETGTITWTVENGVMTVSGTGPMWTEDEVAPFTWPDGTGITEVSRYAFEDFTELTSVTVIGDEALGYYMDDYWYGSELIRYFTIYGYTGTAAEVYAKENGIDFVALDAPQPHVYDYIGEVTEPTCTEQGYTTYICDCGDSFVDEYVAALGHAYENGACIRCGASLENPFTDVSAGSFYEESVLWAVEMGITNGLSATEFGPTATCNRAQVVTFLYRAFNSPDVSAEDLPFTDVPAGAWYEASIAWAVANGITNGLSATEFGPNTSCNRAQVVTFLYRAYQG